MSEHILQLTNEFLLRTLDGLKLLCEQKDKRIEELERNAIATKSRYTWKRAFDNPPPLEKIVIVADKRNGISRAQFEIITEEIGKGLHAKGLAYCKPNDSVYFWASEETCWIEMPEPPGAES